MKIKNLQTKWRTSFESGLRNYCVLGALMLAFNVGTAQEKIKSEPIDQDEESEEYEKGQSTECGGIERWSVKVLVDPAVNTINFTPVSSTISQLVNLTTPTPSSTMPRYPGVEDITYNVVCTVTIKKSESDNDYHLVLSDGTNTMIGEIPDPTCSAAASSNYVNDFIAGRNFVDTYIGSGNIYTVNIPPVLVYGVAFVDPPHGQTGAAPNNLELHPILNIQFANTTSIKTADPLLSVNLFPNPASDKLTLHIASRRDRLENCEFRVFSSMGSLVKAIPLPSSGFDLNTTMDINDLGVGMYYYRVTKDGKPFFEGKFAKQ